MKEKLFHMYQSVLRIVHFNSYDALIPRYNLVTTNKAWRTLCPFVSTQKRTTAKPSRGMENLCTIVSVQK